MNAEMNNNEQVLSKKIGANLRKLRNLKGMSQEKLGNALGITFQQVQKYENGANRLSVPKLVQCSHILQAPVASFFEGTDAFGYNGEDVENLLTPELVPLFKLLQGLHKDMVEYIYITAKIFIKRYGKF